ncbi:hypothetical protein BT69DRAFT_1328215 [Atractiella rhizophila]|nr:hypothetical protein BT69DRAFT_1328215 [Atractiella rhizophila]
MILFIAFSRCSPATKSAARIAMPSQQSIRRIIYLSVRALIFVSCITGIGVLSGKLQHEDSFDTDGDADIQDVAGIVGFSLSLAWTIASLLLFYFHHNRSNASPPYHRAFDLLANPISGILVIGLVFGYAVSLNYDYRKLDCLTRDPNCQRYAGLMNRLQKTSYGFAVISAAGDFFLAGFTGMARPESIHQ